MLVHEGHESARRFFTPANAGSYDKVVCLATLGQDSIWKREIIKAIGDRDSVLELACGTGILSLMLAGPGKSLTGIDLSFEYLCALRLKLSTAVAQGTAEVLPYRDESFDAVVSSYLAKYVDVQSVVDECWRVLKPGGSVLFHDFSYPPGPMRGIWSAYFSLLRLVGKIATPWKTVFDQLDDVIKNSDWIDKTTAALANRGFKSLCCRYYTTSTAAIVSAEKP